MTLREVLDLIRAIDAVTDGDVSMGHQLSADAPLCQLRKNLRARADAGALRMLDEMKKAIKRGEPF